jgi:hypothetical protein
VISFWVNRQGAFGIENYLQERGKPIADRVQVRLYDWRSLEAGGGAQIFSSLDQLTGGELEGLSALHARLSQLNPPPQLLNDPRRSLIRYELLQQLADQGLNSFRAYRADQRDAVRSYPVFLRENRGHNGSLTELLESEKELDKALLALRIRGYDREDLLVVEFCDTSDADGIFRKYAAFRVGDAIIPCHLMTSRDWSVKHSSSETTLQMLQEELEFHERNRFEPWLRSVFGLAGIQYGRLDFGSLNGRPQAWEINTNPTLGRNPHNPRRVVPPELKELREHTRDLWHSRLRQAFAELDQQPETGRVQVQLDAGLLRRIEKETGRAARSKQVLARLQPLYRTRLVAPLRAAVRRWFSSKLRRGPVTPRR